jgi:Mediator complex subunit 29
MIQQPSSGQQEHNRPLLAPQQSQVMEKMDNITKVKSIVPNLKESLKAVFTSAATLLQQNSSISNGYNF